MSDQPRTPYLGTYLVTVIAALAAVWVLRLLLASAVGVELSPGGLAFVPPLAGALICGQKWGRERGEIPASPIAWRWAFVTGIVFLAIQVLLLPLTLISLPQPLDTGLIGILVMSVLFYTAIAIFVHRFFLTMGAGQVVRSK